MKLDATDFRYLSAEEFRVLTAVEMGSKNHEVIPSPLIAQISGIRSGGVQNSKYDGYRLTYGGYDYLAIRALSKRDSVHSIGNQIGVGKESDIYVVADVEGNEMVLKLHRLGRISFRAIKTKRDYMGKRKSASWMYMSRLAAQKEWAFMKVLHENGFPVPKPIDHARHCILMEFIDAFPLRQVSDIPSPGRLYSSLMDLIVRLARAGLIHGDFNEFNILIRRDSGEPVVIDFPQMVSTSHENAEWYFNRDVECIRTFFRRRFRYESALYPKFKSTLLADDSQEGDGFRLDVVVAASGFAKKDMKTLEKYMETLNVEDGNDEGRIGATDHEYHEETEEDEEESEEDGYQDQDQDQNEVDGDDGKGVEEDNDEKSSHDAEEDIDLHIHQPERVRSTSPSREYRETSRVLGEAASSSSPASPNPAEESSQLAESSPKGSQNIKEKVASDLSKQRARQHSKYHSRHSTQRVGRPKGSKAKQNVTVKLDKHNVWE